MWKAGLRLGSFPRVLAMSVLAVVGALLICAEQAHLLGTDLPSTLWYLCIPMVPRTSMKTMAKL